MKLLDKIKTKFRKEEVKAEVIPEPIPETIPEAPKPPEVTFMEEMIVVSQAPNPQWVYARRLDHNGRYAVVIPKRLAGKLVKKRIMVEGIQDETGISYRYVHKT